MLLQANVGVDLGAIIAEYSWVLVVLGVILGILVIGTVVVLRRYEIGPFKKYPYECLIWIGIPPRCNKIQTTGRINLSNKDHPTMEFKFPKGAIAPVPNYEEYANLSTLNFFGTNRSDIHPMAIAYDETTKKAIMNASIDDRMRGVYKQNTKSVVERTTEWDKIMQYLPIIGGVMILLIIIFGGYWISSMTSTAAGVFASAASVMSEAAKACAAAKTGPLPP